MDREAWRAAVNGVAKSRHNWAIELTWTELKANWKKSDRERQMLNVIYMWNLKNITN